MFKKNTKHTQKSLFGLFNSLPESMQTAIKASSEYHFYNLIFCHIPEEKFSELYSNKKSRPNAAVNAMVAAIILKEKYVWSYEELFKSINFNILTKIALGLDQIDDIPFCQASLFNFQNRLSQHFIKTGENLLEQVFDHLTAKQLKALKIKTDIQRTDSFAAASNIRNYSRLQLLIEMIIRLHRVLSDEDKKRFQQEFEAYIKKSSGQYIYHLNAGDLPHELDKVGQLFFWIYNTLYSSYSECEIFQVFKRVYTEHFTVVEEKITIKSPDQLTSNCVQSPDDFTATFREKNGKKSKGRVVNVAETANPENPLELLTDIAVFPNNSDDGKNLGERVDNLIRKTPDLDEIHFDGVYGNTDNDEKFAQLGILPIQTAVRGKKGAVSIEIEQLSENEYTVSCPYQQASSEPTRKRFKVNFDSGICSKCSECPRCPAVKTKKYHVFYFTYEQYLNKKRQNNINSIPFERRWLRNNVEATVHEFTHRMPQRKLKVRGNFKSELFAFSVGIAINFGRIYRFILENPDYFYNFFLSLCKIVKELLKYRGFLLTNVKVIRISNFIIKIESKICKKLNSLIACF